MRFQLALLGLAAQTIQVLGVPAAEPRDGITAFDSFPTDKVITHATAAGEDAVLPAGMMSLFHLRRPAKLPYD
ncbi:hypothetical protein DL764_003052 [Monosporascus ibericus]|uniref:Uncharacterized protein n=1 Tax=Monosporascus ibericus TaxID=155417 RepID=A0A4Q4TM08_9PEZI|nr:hypothetical protein DL764_003052 [Monosporascus ibericus]